MHRLAYRSIGYTYLTMSRLDFLSQDQSIVVGCEQLGGTDWGELNLPDVERAIDHAWSCGIRAFDTADVYGLGESERRLSKVLGARRHDAVIITKGGVRWVNGDAGRARTTKDNSPAYLRSAIEASLRRLEIDTIPLYFVHWPDGQTPLELVFETLAECRDAGKIRYVGLSNFPYYAVETASRDFGLDAVQLSFNLLEKEGKKRTLDQLSALEVERFGYGPLAQGLLAGKFSANTKFSANDRRHRLPHFAADQWDRNLRVLDRVAQIARQVGRSTTEVVLRWTLQTGLIDHLIVGVKTPAQIDMNVSVLEWALSESQMKALDEASCLA